LAKNNLYSKLDFEEQENIEKEMINCVEMQTKIIEDLLPEKYKGIKLQFTSNNELRIHASLYNGDDYRGVIECSRLLLMCNYQMFFQMDYSEIVWDGKNIDAIRMMQFR